MRFAIIASPRTGSSHLTDLLNSRRDILCNGEILHSKKVFVHWRGKDRSLEKLAELAELRATDPVQFLERIFQTNYDRPNVGFKILRGQQKNVFHFIMEDCTIKKVVLFRRNVLANYSSKLIANETRQYALNAKKVVKEATKRPTMPFDADEFIRFRRRYEAYYTFIMDTLLESGQDFHLINYEEINNRHFFRSLLNFLGADLQHTDSEGKHIKQNPSNILSRFSNPDVVEAFLRENDLPHWSFEGQVLFDTDNSALRSRRKRGSGESRSGPAPVFGNSGCV
jgi:hypothetical protein